MSNEFETGQTQEYVMTLDIGERLQQFRRLGFEVPRAHDDMVTDLQKETVGIVQDALPNAHITPIYASDLADDILGVANNLPAVKHGAAIVSTSPDIAGRSGGHQLQIDKLVDIHRQTIGIGPRPGHDLLRHQLNRIGYDSPQGVLVVEEGVFSGETTSHIVQSLTAARIAVKGVVIGLNCAANGEMPAELTGHDYYVAKPLTNAVDWMSDFDFIPFLPGSGKTVGTAMGSDVVPYFDHRGATYTFPRLEPFGKISEWAAIPQEKARKASTELITLAIATFRDIEQRNARMGRSLTIGDLMQTHTRTGVPIEPGHITFPKLDSRPSQFLNEVL